MIKGECEHKRVKKMYARTNKREHEGQIAIKGHREGLLVKIKNKEEDLKSADSQGVKGPGEDSPVIFGLPPQPKKKRGRPKKSFFALGSEDNDCLPQTSFDAHHHISDSQRFAVDIPKFLAEYGNDPGVKVHLKV